MDPITTMIVGGLAFWNYLDNKRDEAQFQQLHRTDNEIKSVVVEHDRTFVDVYGRIGSVSSDATGETSPNTKYGWRNPTTNFTPVHRQ